MKRKTLLVAAIILIISGAVLAYFKFFKSPALLNPQTENQDSFPFVFADLDGDGTREKVNVEPLTDEEDNSAFILVAYDQKGKEIARTGESIYTPEPMEDSLQVVKLFSDLPKETIRFDVFAGPHSSETFFFTQVKDIPVIAPVCKVKEYKSFQDCAFWSGELGELVSVDLDDDKILEIIEYVDEYPKLGEIGEETENTVREVFSEDGLENKVDDMIEIAKREQGGRGRKVVWNIYRFGKDQFFERLTDDDFEAAYLLLESFWKESFPDEPLISKNEMSRASYNFAEMMKNTWELKN